MLKNPRLEAMVKSRNNVEGKNNVKGQAREETRNIAGERTMERPHAKQEQVLTKSSEFGAEPIRLWRKDGENKETCNDKRVQLYRL